VVLLSFFWGEWLGLGSSLLEGLKP
jgi:hypothetical protein